MCNKGKYRPVRGFIGTAKGAGQGQVDRGDRLRDRRRCDGAANLKQELSRTAPDVLSNIIATLTKGQAHHTAELEQVSIVALPMRSLEKSVQLLTAAEAKYRQALAKDLWHIGSSGGRFNVSKLIAYL